MKFRLLAPAVAFSALALVGGTAVTSGTAVAASKPDCSRQIVNVPAKEAVKVRTSKKVNATAVSQWNKGKKGSLCNDGHFYTGQKYKKCGKTSTKWLYGSEFGKKRGWIPAACIKWS